MYSHGTNSPPVVRSYDPNDKLGPAGYGSAGYLPAGGVMAYQIRFENVSDATAPAQRVVVTDALDPNLDLSTFELTEIAFANQTVAIPAGLNHYETRLAFTVTNQTLIPLGDATAFALAPPPTNAILVEVAAHLDVPTRLLTLTLAAIDPNTGWYPENPLTGFLYPNDDTGRGDGSISFLVRPLPDLPTDSTITNKADIVFDYNDPIITPLVLNTIDADAPTSAVSALPANVTSSTFLVSWSGSDLGSGIVRYDIYFATSNAGPWSVWQQNTTNTSAYFPGVDNTTFYFHSISRDGAGNVESTPVVADAFTTTVSNSAPTLERIEDQLVDANSALVLTNRAHDFLLPGQQMNFTLLSAPAGARIRNVSTNESRFVWIPACEQGGTTNVITIQVSDNGTPPLTATQTFLVTVPDCVQVKLGNAVVRAGDSVAVPVELLSTVQLSNLWLHATYPETQFTNLTLLINTQQVLAMLDFDFPGANLLVMGWDLQTDHTLRFLTNVATLGATAYSNQSSAFTWIHLPLVEARRLDGTLVTNAYGLSGRIVVVGEEPLLEALHAPSNQVALIQYAPTGSAMTIEWSTNVFSGDWQPLIQNTQSNLVQETGNVIPDLPMLFFQAIRGTNGL